MPDLRSVSAVLASHGYPGTSESAIASNLDGLLTDAAHTAEIDLSQADADYLTQHSGVNTASTDELLELDVRAAARATAEATLTMNRSDVARGLGIDPSRVSHKATAGDLFSYRDGADRPVYPDWQFIPAMSSTEPPTSGGDMDVLPGLRIVLASVPVGTHPLSIRAFMTTANADLLRNGVPVSPRAWLASGGDPAPVAEQAATLGEQV